MWGVKMTPELEKELGARFVKFVETMIEYFQLHEVYIAVFVTEEDNETTLKFAKSELRYFMVIVGLQQYEEELSAREAAEVSLIHELQHIRLLLDGVELPVLWADTLSPVVYYANPEAFLCFATEVLWQRKLQPYLDSVIDFIRASGKMDTIKRCISQLPYRHTQEVVRMLERR